MDGEKKKNPPANAGDMVSSLCQEDLPKKEMATHSSILAWEIPWTEDPGRLQSIWLKKSQTQLSAKQQPKDISISIQI